jgi:hypothetical protein
VKTEADPRIYGLSFFPVQKQFTRIMLTMQVRVLSAICIALAIRGIGSVPL